MARPLVVTIPTPRGGWLSVLGLVVFTGLSTTAVWQLADQAWAFLNLAVAGPLSMFAADWMIFDDNKHPDKHVQVRS